MAGHERDENAGLAGQGRAGPARNAYCSAKYIRSPAT